jgi:hypothetical protein
MSSAQYVEAWRELAGPWEDFLWLYLQPAVLGGLSVRLVSCILRRSTS